MRTRLVATAVLAAALGLGAVPSHAAAPAPQLTDATGDANFVNGQGAVLGLPNPATDPASVKSLDIVSVRWATKFAGTGRRRTPTDVVVTMTLAGAPSEQGKSAIWRAMWTVGDCDFLANYSISADAGPSAQLRACSLDPDGDPLAFRDSTPKVAVNGATITWTLPLKQLKALGIKPGTVLEGLSGHVRLLTGVSAAAATVVTADEAATDKVYRVGS